MIPNKLKNDSLLETLCEIRFESEEIQEIVLGRLSDQNIWRGYSKHRLPTSDIPAPIRAANPQLQYQATLEFRSSDGTHVIKIGGNVISCHVVNNYPGWKSFQEDIHGMVHALFSSIDAVNVVRIGFRYINSLTLEQHFINGLESLDLNIVAGQQTITKAVNLNYYIEPENGFGVMTRIATPDFSGAAGFPPDGKAFIDIDVFTPNEFSESNEKTVLGWIEKAHTIEKEAFFGLIPDTIIEKLKVN